MGNRAFLQYTEENKREKPMINNGFGVGGFINSVRKRADLENKFWAFLPHLCIIVFQCLLCLRL